MEYNFYGIIFLSLKKLHKNELLKHAFKMF
jgi:hypothetical protein